jgi:hypothetical protein
MINMMPYQLALAEKTMVHFASDSPIAEVQTGIEHGSIEPTTMVAVNLTSEDLRWLKSSGIASMVRSVEA